MNAWVKLSDKHEDRKVWDKFTAKFSFDPNRKGSAINEPSPSLTFDLAPLYKQGLTNSVSDPLVNTFHAAAFRCLRKSIPADQFYYVLVWSSTTYQFFPRAEGFDPKDIASWEVPVLPVKGHRARLLLNAMCSGAPRKTWAFSWIRAWK